MSIRIPYDQGLQLGKMTAQAVHQVLEARYAIKRVKLIMDKAQWGNPADWASLAVELGLRDIGSGATLYSAAQQAQDMWTLIANATQAIDVPAINDELARLDQG